MELNKTTGETTKEMKDKELDERRSVNEQSWIIRQYNGKVNSRR